MERTNPANTIPRIGVERSFSLAFISFHKTWNKELVSESIELHSPCFTVTDHLIVVIETHYFGHSTRLRSIVRDFVAFRGGYWLTAGQTHQSVTVSRCHVDTALFRAPTEKFLYTEFGPLRCELGPSREDTGDPHFLKASALLF